MAQANPPFDPAQFIAFARKQMGEAGESGTLADAFKTATGYVPFQQWPNFWQVGCVFDTILDYFLTLKEAGELNDDDRKLMGQLMSQAAFGYQYGIVGLAAAWYDDWSWWGIAASKAFDASYEDIFGDQLEFFQSVALDMWGLVDAGEFATVANSIPDSVWAHSQVQDDGTKFTSSILSARSQLHIGTRNSWAMIQNGQDGFGTPRQNADFAYFTSQVAGKWAVPRYSGGCWQYDFSTLHFPCNDGPDWANPNPNAQYLGVFQLTLMPGLYLSFACSLMAAAIRKAVDGKSGGAWDRLQPLESYRKPADEVVGFLTDWLNVGQPDSLASPFPEGALVRERTPTYATLPDNSYPAVQSAVSDAWWTGDQGLIMGALLQYGALAGDAETETSDAADPPIFTTWPMLLMTGACHNLPSDILAGAVGPFRPETPPIGPFAGDPDDYGSGSGIFWRYVMRCCRIDPGFKIAAGKDPAIVSSATISGGNANAWGNDLFQPFNGVAAAIGAWHLLH